jgi:hypothetical protein
MLIAKTNGPTMNSAVRSRSTAREMGASPRRSGRCRKVRHATSGSTLGTARYNGPDTPCSQLEGVDITADSPDRGWSNSPPMSCPAVAWGGNRWNFGC